MVLRHPVRQDSLPHSTSSTVLRTFACKTGPESGLDCLMCATFARQSNIKKGLSWTRHFIAVQSAPAPHLARPEGRAALTHLCCPHADVFKEGLFGRKVVHNRRTRTGFTSARPASTRKHPWSRPFSNRKYSGPVRLVLVCCDLNSIWGPYRVTSRIGNCPPPPPRTTAGP